MRNVMRRLQLCVLFATVVISLSACASLRSDEPGNATQMQTRQLYAQIRPSYDKLVNTVSSNNIILERISARLEDALRDREVEASSSEISGKDRIVLVVEYEYLENDTMLGGKLPVFTMKGQIKLIDKNGVVLFHDNFQETEGKISDFEKSIPSQIAKKVYKYFR